MGALAAGDRVPRLAPMVVLWWCGALLSLRWGAAPLVVAIGGAMALLAARDLHGVALAAGVLLAAVTRPSWRPAAAF